MQLFKHLFFIIFFISTLYSHQYHESYISFDYNKTTPTLLWEIEGDNLEQILTLDDSNNSIISWKEYKNHKKEILEYSKKYISLKIDDKLVTIPTSKMELKRYDDQTYMLVYIDVPKTIPKKIEINYNLFFKMDSLQRCLIKVSDENSTKLFTLFRNRENIVIKLEEDSFIDNLQEFFIDGIWHILVGLDHILFLLMLIIPAVKNQKEFSKVAVDIAKIVTSFSIAHAISLTMSIYDMIDISSNFIDIMIALSVLLTALNNIFEKIKGFSWQIAFGFGIIHGFGFANALGGLELSSEFFIYFVAIFNIGIEVGQFGIVIIVLPVLFMIRDTSLYLKGILKIGSILTAIISTIWIFQRI